MTFTPIEATVGAVLIQLATTNFYWQRGQTMGFSSAMCSCVSKFSSSSIQIVSGMLMSSFFVKMFLPQFVPPPMLATGNIPILSLAGLLVGLGTKLGQGCTSGHMIGGLSRLRKRSLVATALFSMTAMIVVFFTGNGEAVATSAPNYAIEWNTSLLSSTVIQALLATASAAVYFILPQISKRATCPRAQRVLSWFHGMFSGFLFGVGLHVSGMLSASKTIGFLSMPTPQFFDPSLAMIMLFAVVPNIPIWRKIEQEKPLLCEKFDVATATEIPLRFAIGAVIFGAGWGLIGVCPGPGLLNLVHNTQSALYWLSAFLAGQYLGQYAY